jgi:hypothetical protein
MKRALGLVLLAAVACSDPTPTQPVAKASPYSISQGSAAALLEKAVRPVVTGSASFEQRVLIGPEGGIGKLTQDGAFDAKAKLWKSRLTLTSPASKAGPSTIDFVGTTTHAYVQSPTWTGALKDHWLQYDGSQLTAVGGTGADLADGLPPVVLALASAKAVSGKQDGDTTRVVVTISAADALVLENLKTGLSQLKVDLASITGTASAIVTITDDRLVSLSLPLTALDGVKGRLPAPISQLASQTTVQVDFDDLGTPVSIHVPSGDEIGKQP